MHCGICSLSDISAPYHHAKWAGYYGRPGQMCPVSLEFDTLVIFGLWIILYL